MRHNARRYRVTERSVLVTSSRPYGHPTGATGVHARRTATLPEAVGRRQRGSAMFAAKPHEAEQELPEGIPEPRNVTRVIREWRCPVATGDQTSATNRYPMPPPTGPLAFQLKFGRTSAPRWPQTGPTIKARGSRSRAIATRPERRDHACAVPELHCVSVYKLSGPRLCAFIVSTS
jgi:hypothetical protein